jgi:8-oxo-dGTP diphosphatase
MFGDVLGELCDVVLGADGPPLALLHHGACGEVRETMAVPEHRVVAAVLRRGDRVLLCHRCPARQWYPNVWDFPGGHVDDGERPEQALRRELIEELGVDIGTIEGDPVCHLSDAGKGFDLTLWVIGEWRGRGRVENRQLDEHDDIAWFGARDLHNLKFADSSHLSLLEHVLATTT